MGKQSRAGRARARVGRASGLETRAAVDPGSEWLRQQTSNLLILGVRALDRGRPDLLDHTAAELAGCCRTPGDRRVVLSAITAVLREAVSRAWALGWQPADLHRLVGRRHGPLEQLVVNDAMSHDLSGYAPSTVDRQWWAQLRELEATVWWESSLSHLEARLSRETDIVGLVAAAVSVLHVLTGLPALEQLTSLPGEARGWGGDEPDAGGAATGRPAVDERILSRVRQLLAKAESTTFEAEAETFTAGAQALMARHSIDAALLACDERDRTRRAGPQGRRIGIATPYDRPKAMLLQAVASANRCRVVWHRELGFGTVVGFETDLACVELLFTSLLVQATRAMTAAGTRTDAFGQSRTRAFRQSFLVAFASRIGERLTQAMATEIEAAAPAARSVGRELVPLLAARTVEVEEVFGQWFPSVRPTSAATVRDGEGWRTGRAAADRADLGAGPALEEGP